MKRCPTCTKTFTDQNLSYCIDDGTPLLEIPEDDEPKEVQPNSSATYAPPAYQPPSYTPPEIGTKRRVWPWLVGIGAVLVLALVGFVVAAVMMIPRLKESRQPVVISNSNSKEDESSAANPNSNQSNATSPASNTNSRSGSTTPVPTDKELVLTQLKDLEHEWTVANINADKKKLGEILADDYVGPDARGRMQGKAEYIDTIQRDTNTQSWEFEDLKLTLRGDRATLIGKVRFKFSQGEALFDFVDRFVWRDNRWQATGSEMNQSE